MKVNKHSLWEAASQLVKAINDRRLPTRVRRSPEDDWVDLPPGLQAKIDPVRGPVIKDDQGEWEFSFDPADVKRLWPPNASR